MNFQKRVLQSIKPNDGKWQISFSSLVPYIPGEDVLARHRRRADQAKANESKVRQWCEFRGVEMLVRDDSRHVHDCLWRFRVRLIKNGAQAIWNPGTGLAFRHSDCRDGVKEYRKIHDWQQLLDFLTVWFDRIPREAVSPASQPLAAK
jgi:hypothetical protein